MPALSQRDILAFVVATGFAAGLNVYATAFSLGAMARLHWVELPVGLDLLANTWILIASGSLFAVEVLADKIPKDSTRDAARCFSPTDLVCDGAGEAVS